MGKTKSRRRSRDELRPPRTALLLQGDKQGAWYLHLNNPREIGQRIGVDVLGAFMRCFVGVDRSTSITNLLRLNEEGGGAPGSHTRSRNQWFLLLLMAGTMHEVGEALQGLATKNVPSKMQDRSKWDALDKIRRRWHTNPVASKIRNQLSHHLGDPKVYTKGLEFQLGKRRLQLYCADGPVLGQGTYEGAWNSITRGLDLDLSDYMRLYGQMGSDVPELHRALLDVFLDVFRFAGIPDEDQRRA